MVIFYYTFIAGLLHGLLGTVLSSGAHYGSLYRMLAARVHCQRFPVVSTSTIKLTDDVNVFLQLIVLSNCFNITSPR